MTYPVSVRVLLRCHATAIQQHIRPLVDGALDQSFNTLLTLRADQWAEISIFLESTVDIQRLCSCDELGEPLLRLANHHKRAQRHTSLTCGAEGGTSNRIEGMLFVTVWQDSCVVLCAQVGLHTLAIGTSSSEDIFTGAVGSDERDGFNGWLVNDEVNGLCRTVDDVDNSVRHTCLLA
jgi:hypothetical protein